MLHVALALMKGPVKLILPQYFCDTGLSHVSNRLSFHCTKNVTETLFTHSFPRAKQFCMVFIKGMRLKKLDLFLH